jgi:hypothetical protein
MRIGFSNTNRLAVFKKKARASGRARERTSGRGKDTYDKDAFFVLKLALL